MFFMDFSVVKGKYLLSEQGKLSMLIYKNCAATLLGEYALHSCISMGIYICVCASVCAHYMK